MHPLQKHSIEKLGKAGIDALAQGYKPSTDWGPWAYESTFMRRAELSPHHDVMHTTGNAIGRIEDRYSDIPLCEGLTVDIEAHAKLAAEYDKAESAIAVLEDRYALEHINTYLRGLSA